MWAQTINVLLGLLVTVLPDLWQFGKTETDNNHIAGPLIVTFAVTALWEVNRNIRFFNVLAGAWLIIGSLVLSFQFNATLINLLTGAALIACSLIKGKIKKRYGGGWRSLWAKFPLHMHDQPLASGEP